VTKVGYCLGSVHYPCGNCGEELPKKWGIYVTEKFAKFAIRIWICEDCLRLQLNKIKDTKVKLLEEIADKVIAKNEEKKHESLLR